MQRRPLAEYETLDSLSLVGRRPRRNELEYWDQSGIDRIAFLQTVVQRLDQRDWPNKVDLGWNNFDVEVYGSRWSHLQLMTATEVVGPNQQMIRCRLRTVWTLFTKATFWGLVGVELLLLSFLAPFFPWLWTILLTLPIFIWWLNRERRSLERLMTVFLDETAKEVGLTRVRESIAPNSSGGAASQPGVGQRLAFKGSDRV